MITYHYNRHTQRKEIAQNLLGNMSLNDVKAEDMSFTDMMNDIHHDMRNESDDDDDDVRYAQLFLYLLYSLIYYYFLI